MNISKFFTIFSSTLSFCFILMICSTTMAQDISSEYNDAMSEASEVADWDTDGDVELDAHEFYVVNYRIWDTDDDSQISEEEWQAGMDSYIVDRSAEMAMFPDWDTNQDKQLDVNEYTLAMVEIDPFEFNTNAPRQIKDEKSMNNDQIQNQDMQDDPMKDATVMIWQLDNDNLIEKITYGDWNIKLDEDDN
jgi:hypothetical protein